MTEHSEYVPGECRCNARGNEPHPMGDAGCAYFEPPHKPADRGDVRFEITALEEPEIGATHLVLTIDDRGEIVARDVTDLPFEFVEAYREAQNTTLDERFDLYAARGW